MHTNKLIISGINVAEFFPLCDEYKPEFPYFAEHKMLMCHSLV